MICLIWAKGFIIAFLAAVALTPLIIPFLRKLKFGQEILEDGPVWHQTKRGTPTMGGIAMIAAFTATVLVFERSAEAMFILFCALAFALVGFWDDYTKVRRKRNKGIDASQKFAAQSVVAICAAIYIYFFAENPAVAIPFAPLRLDIGVFSIPLIIFVMLATVNSVNLTDGIDGLAASVSAITGLFFAIACTSYAHDSAAFVVACMSGVCLGFLIYNFFPAKVFMGDTGSLFLGGVLSATAVCCGLELFLIGAGFIFLAESLSDIIQVAHYKRTKKRVFKMAPIHHHFEQCGWRETQIVAFFSIITLFFCVICFLGLR